MEGGILCNLGFIRLVSWLADCSSACKIPPVLLAAAGGAFSVCWCSAMHLPVKGNHLTFQLRAGKLNLPGIKASFIYKNDFFSETFWIKRWMVHKGDTRIVIFII